MQKNILFKGFIRLAIILYIFIWIGMGIRNFYMKSVNFYLVERQFSPYLGSFPSKNDWCFIIADEEFLSKTEAERKMFAESFFDKVMKESVALCGYDTLEFKDWFLAYAASNVESIPLKEYQYGSQKLKFRDVDLSNMPHRKMQYFFLDRKVFIYAFLGLLIFYLPVLLIVILSRWIYLEFRKQG
ncbi:MAG: hypothetical protein DRP74_04805 [Candidatus Omnitrophota bacterium]|nr:MAG: hypothetical protein DRP74_04805 [Candidatus Omnitrophota bacterium]